MRDLQPRSHPPQGGHEAGASGIEPHAPQPERAVVGQRNHGLTITGHSLDEIFARIDGRIVRKVPMD